MRMPPFLMGLGLLFWGWRVGLLPWAAALAVVLELAHWVRARWELSDTDLKRIWDICTLLVVGEAMILISSQDRAWGQISFQFFQWLPLPILPIMLAQAYGNREKMPLTVFSVLLRRAMNPALASKALNISYFYFLACLIGASATSRDHILFYPGMVILISLALLSARPQRITVFWWALLMSLAAIGGFASQGGLRAAQSSLEASLIRWVATYFRRDPTDLRESRTSIGHAGTIKLSGRIVLRVTPERSSPPPSLLREASYDSYNAGVWNATFHEFSSSSVDTNDVATLLAPKKIQFAARIGGFLRNGTGILAVPHGTFELRDLPVVTLLTNRLGLMKVEQGPSLVNFLALYGPGATIDGGTNLMDTEVPRNEREIFNQVAAELDLNSKTDFQKIRAIDQFFQEHFSYSLKITPRHIDPTGMKTAMGQFLTTTRSGHCEYFASATVLLLRSVGIPARYVTGYSVQEHAERSKTYIVRERHGHAWTMVYRRDLNRWVELDTTPASWKVIDNEDVSPWEPVSDFFSKIWYEFAKWRESKTSYTSYLRWALAFMILLFVWRLIFQRRRKRAARHNITKNEPTWPGLDSEFFLLDRELSSAGLGRLPDESFDAWTGRVPLPGVELLARAFHLHRRLRFDPKSLSSEDRQALRQDVGQWLAEYKARPQGNDQQADKSLG